MAGLTLAAGSTDLAAALAVVIAPLPATLKKEGLLRNLNRVLPVTLRAGKVAFMALLARPR